MMHQLLDRKKSPTLSFLCNSVERELGQGGVVKTPSLLGPPLTPSRRPILS